MIEGLVALKLVGSSLFGWGLGKFCDKSILATHKQIQNRLKDKGLDPNHDIERAVLTAHYEALQFIIEHAFSREDDKRVEAYSNRLKTTRKVVFPKVFKAINDPKLENLPTEMAGDWQTIIPTTFEPAAGLADVHKAMPQAYIAQAETDLLNLAGWSDVEEQALKQWIADPVFGWVPSFSACLRRQIKVNEPFYKIFSATNQQHQLRALASIEEQLKTQLSPNGVLSKAMSRVEESLKRIEDGVDEANERLERIEEKIDQSVKRQHYENEVGHQYPIFLARLLIKSDVDEGLWEDEITTALTRYVAGKTQLEKQTNLPHHLEAKRAEALALYEQAKLDEGEAILRELVETVTLEKLESAARDHAGLLIDQVPFATAKLDFNRALDLYEQAANAILAIDKRQAIDWLREAGNIARERGELFGEGFLKQAETLYLSATAHCCDRDGNPLPENIDQWAAIQNNLGIVYSVMGQRGEAEALGKAVISYEAALTVYTQDAAPMDWAMTQNNLGIVYSVMGERGEAEALGKAVIAFQAALTVRTQDAAPMQWAMTQNNLGIVYQVMGERGEAEALGKAVIAYEAALTVYTQDAAPIQWAMTQNNLGIVYQVMGQRGEAEALGKAVIAYEAALTLYTQDAAPMQWAMTQNNLGIVYQVMGERGEAEALGKSVIAYEAALTVYTQDAAPMDWARCVEGLAGAYLLQNKRKQSDELSILVLKYYQENDVEAYKTALLRILGRRSLLKRLAFLKRFLFS